MSRESEYRKMEKELREWIGGAQIIPDGQEDRFRFRGRIRTPTKIKKKEKPKRETVGGIFRMVTRVVKMIFNEEEVKQDN